MKRHIILAFVVCLAGCVAVPVLDDDGNAVLNDDGTPKTKQVFDADKANDAARAAAPFLPPPFGQALPLVAGLATLIINRKD